MAVLEDAFSRGVTSKSKDPAGEAVVKLKEQAASALKGLREKSQPVGKEEGTLDPKTINTFMGLANVPHLFDSSDISHKYVKLHLLVKVDFTVTSLLEAIQQYTPDIDTICAAQQLIKTM